jgi:putative transposase
MQVSTNRNLREWLLLLSEERIKKSRFSEEQMVAMLRESDLTSVAGVARKNKVSEQTIYGWKKRFGGLEPADVKRLRQLEAENGKLKRLLAERDLEIDTMKEIARRKW